MKPTNDQAKDSTLVQRLPIRFVADERWVVTRPFFPGGETRVRNVVARVHELSDEQASAQLGRVRTEFYGRHSDMESVLREHYAQAISFAPELREAQRNQTAANRRVFHDGICFCLDRAVQSLDGRASGSK